MQKLTQEKLEEEKKYNEEIIQVSVLVFGLKKFCDSGDQTVPDFCLPLTIVKGRSGVYKAE